MRNIRIDMAGTAMDVPISESPHRKLPTGLGMQLLLEVLRK